MQPQAEAFVVVADGQVDNQKPWSFSTTPAAYEEMMRRAKAYAESVKEKGLRDECQCHHNESHIISGSKRVKRALAE